MFEKKCSRFTPILIRPSITVLATSLLVLAFAFFAAPAKTKEGDLQNDVSKFNQKKSLPSDINIEPNPSIHTTDERADTPIRGDISKIEKKTNPRSIWDSTTGATRSSRLWKMTSEEKNKSLSVINKKEDTLAKTNIPKKWLQEIVNMKKEATD